MKILMVCLGNICRSPLAQGILQQKANIAGLNILVHSASTNSYHTGQPPHHLSVKVAAIHGINISKQQARKFTIADINTYVIIYAMATDVMQEMKLIAGTHWNARKVKLITTEINKTLNIPDPYYGGIDGFYKVFNLLNAICDAIIQKQLTNANK